MPICVYPCSSVVPCLEVELDPKLNESLRAAGPVQITAPVVPSIAQAELLVALHRPDIEIVSARGEEIIRQRHAKEIRRQRARGRAARAEGLDQSIDRVELR